ncbi:MAG: hypothetical protein DCC67_07945 [Planctomycetota bacterium]|nr:MAG: hypothetical protein DCC67_07945 [Planctomycetota bacterium]
MGHFFSDFDALWTLAALVPLMMAAAAWALQMACGFCSVDPPEFWHAVTTVVIIAVVNAVLRFLLQSSDADYGMASMYVAPLVATGAVISLSLPAGPFTAMTITVVQGFLCALIYFGLRWLQTVVAASIMLL